MAACSKFISVVVVLISSAPLRAESDTPVSLFNGTNLHGWTYRLEKPNVRPSDVWSIQDKALHCTGQPTGYLITKKNDYQNYVLSLQWRWPGKGGNNGVLVHATTLGTLGVWPKSFEVQLQSGDAGELWVIGTTLEIQRPATHIEDRRHKNFIRGAEKPIGEWNSMQITCRGSEIEVRVNGYLVNEARNLSQQRGAIALQSEGTPIEYRNITIVNLTTLQPKMRNSWPPNNPAKPPSR